MLRFLASIACSFFLLSVQGQNAQLKGRVSDRTTGTPLEGVTVSLSETGRTTATDALGNFRFAGLEAKSYTLSIQSIAYSALSVIAAAGSNSIVEVQLEPKDIQIEAINIEDQHKRKFSSLSAIDIELRPMRSSQDVLRLIPGLFIAQHAGGGKAEQIFLRGFDIDHGTDISLSLDGMPVNMVSHAHGQGYADLHFVIPETIGRVDFGKGPYHARNGNLNTAGYADFYTLDALPYSSVKLEAGQFNTFRSVALLDLLGDNTNHQAYVAGEYLFTDNYFDSPQGFNRMNLMAKYQGRVGEDALLTISASTFSSNWDASGQIPDRAVLQGLISRFGAIDDTEGGKTGRSNVNLKLVKGLDNGALLQQQLYYSKYDFELYSNFTFFLEDSVNGDQIRQRESRDIIGYKGIYAHSYKLGNMNASTEAGLVLRQDQVEDNELSRSLQRETTLERLAYGDVTETNAALYWEQKLELSPKWLLEAGLRYDQFRFEYQNQLSPQYDRQAVSKGIFSPKISLAYSPVRNVSVFVKSGIGFHSNDSRVILAQTTDEILPQAYGVDLGVAFKPFRNTYVQLAAWGLDLEQEFVYVGDAGIVEPSGETRRTGLELSLRSELLPFLYADIDLNLTRPRAKGVSESEAYIPLAPTFTSIGGLSAKLPGNWQASLRYRFLDDRAANEDYSLTAEGYFLLDAVVSKAWKNLELGFSLENILDQDWKEAQFETESRLRTESESVSEIHFTPGTPFFFKTSLTYTF